MSLSERAGGVLYRVCEVCLRVSGGMASPLAEVLQLFGRHDAGQCEDRIEHRRHVPRVEEETVAERIIEFVGVIVQELRIEDVDEVGASHGSARMSRFCLFDHCRRQYPDVVRRPVGDCVVHD